MGQASGSAGNGRRYFDGGRVRLRHGEDQYAEEEVGAQLPVDQERVFPELADARQCRRSRSSTGPVSTKARPSTAPPASAGEREQGEQLRLHRVVIVVARA